MMVSSMSVVGECIQAIKPLGFLLSTDAHSLLSDYPAIPIIIVKTSLDPGYLKSGLKVARKTKEIR